MQKHKSPAVAGLVDLPQILEVQRKAYGREFSPGSHVYDIVMGEGIDDIKRRIESPDSRVYKSVDSTGGIVSSLSFLLDSEKKIAYAFRLSSIKQGSGMRLVKSCLPELEREGIKKIFIHPPRDSRQLSVYKRIGARDATDEEKGEYDRIFYPRLPKSKKPIPKRQEVDLLVYEFPKHKFGPQS
ncbi:MAG: hypothetical protein ABH950_06665 [Candidatus Altiarchaeota archaeon]